jgi:hypothetical protein
MNRRSTPVPERHPDRVCRRCLVADMLRNVNPGRRSNMNAIDPVNFRLIAAMLSSLSLMACSTPVQIQVPVSEAEHFSDCMKDPTTSYTRQTPKVAQVNLFDIGGSSHLTLPQGATHLFVTNDQLVSGKPLAPPTGWSNSKEITDAFNASAAELNAAADEVEALWDSPAHQLFLRTFNTLGTPGASAEHLGTLSAQDVRDYLKLSQSVAARNGWQAFAVRSAAHLFLLLQDQSASDKQKILAAQKFIGAVFISTYLQAYFRNGRFIELGWDLGNPVQDLQTLAGKTQGAEKQKIDSIIQAIDKVDPNAAANLATILNKNFSGTIGKIADTGLVLRGGDPLAMPGVSIDFKAFNSKPLTVTKVDFNAVLEDVVRVTFEALFDALNEVPAVTQATGVEGLPKQYSALALPEFTKVTSAYRPGKPTMDQNEFAAVDSDGAKAHAFAAATTANLIRGASIAALNNESLANTLTTIAGTAARKVTERAVWCYYAAVGPSPDPSKPITTFSTPQGHRMVTFDLSY